jgi:hypothetical protein
MNHHHAIIRNPANAGNAPTAGNGNAFALLRNNSNSNSNNNSNYGSSGVSGGLAGGKVVNHGQMDSYSTPPRDGQHHYQQYQQYPPQQLQHPLTMTMTMTPLSATKSNVNVTTGNGYGNVHHFTPPTTTTTTANTNTKKRKISDYFASQDM